jgi:nitrogen regulatory protein PII
MKMLMMVVEASMREELEVVLEQAGLPGYTEIPRAAGRGETGPRLGSRTFPRTSTVVFTFVPDDQVEPLRGKLREFCAHCGERLRLVAWDAEEMRLTPP